MGRLVEADALLASLKVPRAKASVWLSDCREYGSNMTGRAEQAVMTLNDCIQKVEEAPTVDAVPVRHGYWIRHDYADLVDGYYVPNYECSVCHAWKQDDSDYCPDCVSLNDGKDGEHEKADLRR